MKEKLVEKYLNDSDVINVAYKAASRFLGSLSKDEIENCVTTAIWKAAMRYDKRRGPKFTSFVYTGVVFECLTQRKLNNSKPASALSATLVDHYNPIAKIDMIDTIEVKCDDPDLVIDRFYKNMTIRELAKAHSVCGETIRIRLKKNLEKLQSAL